jgi:acyl-CoA-binding protein
MPLLEDFEESSKKVHSLTSKPDNATLLELYSFYKQGKFGNNNQKRPGLLDIKGRKKHDAWENLKGMTPDDAKQKYIELVKKLIVNNS